MDIRTTLSHEIVTNMMRSSLVVSLVVGNTPLLLGAHFGQSLHLLFSPLTPPQRESMCLGQSKQIPSMQRAEAAAPGQTLAGWGGQEEETSLTR